MFAVSPADEQTVKQQLREQQQSWEAEQVASGRSNPPNLQFWSVGKLLRVLQALNSAAKPLESLTKEGIVRYSVGSCDQRRSASQPMTSETQNVPTTDAVTYTSSHIWLTGFLHFGEELDTCDTFYLGDSNAKLLSFLLDPSPQLTGQLVLIKRWVLVDKAFGGVRTAGSMFLEVHDEKLLPLLPVNDPFADWTQEDVLEVLEAQYQTRDPPMYTGMEPWNAAVSRKGEGDDQTVVEKEAIAVVGTGKLKMRKRVHAVFGRVTSVSPISRQKDRASSHFFVEIEHHRSVDVSAIQSVVNVMFTGLDNMRWHLFLRPGKIVLITDLVKVLSRECEMFLLQTTNGHQAEMHEDSTNESRTSVLVWNELDLPPTNVAGWISDTKEKYSTALTSRCCGKLLDYEGQVLRILWDECIELVGPDEIRVIVCLFGFPYEHELVRLRKGSTVRVYDAHVLRLPTPVGGKLVLGMCPRGYLAIMEYGGPSGPCLAMGIRSRRGRAHKKWSRIGYFHRQSMVLSMWLLEVLELLDAKFKFEEEQAQNDSALLSFSGLRRRKAVAHLAKKLGITLCQCYDQTPLTLGALFLKCHSVGIADCIKLQLSSHEKKLAFTRTVTISELMEFGRIKLEKMATEKETDSSDDPLSIRISGDNFDWCVLLGCIRGNIDSGDLEVFDRTGSIALRLHGAGSLTNFDDEYGVYLFHGFDLIIEDYNRVKASFEAETLPLLYCVSCLTTDVEFVSMPTDEDISLSLEENTSTTTQEVQELLFIVTHVDPLPRSDIRLAGLLPEYRVVHGLVCPVGGGLQSNQFVKSMHTAEVLMSSACRTWYIRKGFCYRIRAVEICQDSQTLSTSRTSIENQALTASRNYLENSKDTKFNSSVCFDALHRFSCRGGDESVDEVSSFRVYRMEGKRSSSVIPVKLECDGYESARCDLHELCRRSCRSERGIMVVPLSDDLLPSQVAALFSETEQMTEQTPVKVSTSELIAMSILSFFLRQSEEVYQVCRLLHHPLKNHSQQPIDESTGDQEQPVIRTVDPDLHKPHFTSLVGVITKKIYHWRSSLPQQSLGQVGQSTAIGVKRAREIGGKAMGGTDSTRRLLCILHVRDLQYLDTVEIRVDASRFGLLGSLQLNSVVELSRLQGFIARSSYKVYLNWSHFTAARLIPDSVYASVPPNSELYGVMPTTFLNDLYTVSLVDRRLHRYVVGVMHISYVLLKRKCRTCHQALQLIKRRGCWKHPEAQVGSFTRDCAWSRQQWTPSDPAFRTHTYMGATVRCIIDDGSAQAELFLENKVAWELLTCTDGQRQRFEDILSNYVEELSYFSGRTANGSFATSMAEREQEYYQNELRAFVLDAIPSLRSVVVFAQRFYKTKQATEGTSVLTFGKDVHMTTKTAPQPKLEAKRVDRLHVRGELQRRLSRLRSERESSIERTLVDTSASPTVPT